MNNKYLWAFIKTANTFAQLSTSEKEKVGCVIVKDNRIISIGYNGMPSKWSNVCEVCCADGRDIGPECPRALCDGPKSKPEVLHAEANAITKLARSNESGEGATLFCTHMPCIECAKLIYQSGIESVYFEKHYEASKGSGEKFLIQCKLPLIQLTPTH